ncbi:MAG: hypothetical protein IPH74_13575 [Bacteroidetes bacterium]|nr:hypothetical protein [Bacteroidota bacterium]
MTVFTAPNFDVKVDSQLVYVGSTVQLSVEPILQDVDYQWTPAGQVSDANSPYLQQLLHKIFGFM